MYKGSFDFLSHPPPGFFPYSDKVRLLQKYVIPPQHPTSSRWHRYSCTVDVRNERQSTLPLDFAYWLWVEERGVAAARVVTITSLSLTSDKPFRLTRSTKHRPVHCGIKSQKCRSTRFQAEGVTARSHSGYVNQDGTTTVLRQNNNTCFQRIDYVVRASSKAMANTAPKS